MHRSLTVLAAMLTVTASLPARADDYSTDIVSAQRFAQRQDVAGGIRSLLAPDTKVPKIGPNGTVIDYVRWARSSLDRGQAAEAELSLEWGQVRRRMDEEENALATNDVADTYDGQCERIMCKAMRSIGKGDAAGGRAYLDKALAEFTQEARPHADFADPQDGAQAATLEVGAQGAATRPGAYRVSVR